MNDKDKPEQNDEDHVKLDMSFDDALRLAMKSPPIFTKTLKLSVETELKKVAGRVIEFISLEIDNEIERPSQFMLLVKIINKDGSTTITSLYSKYPISKLPSSHSKGYFVIFESPKFTLDNTQKIFLTVVPAEIYKSQVKHILISYTLATKF